jgi:hypothetical protein
MADQRLVKLLRHYADIHGDDITLSKFLRECDLPVDVVAKLLAAWPQLRAEAGLPEAVPRAGRRRFTHDDLMAEYDRLRRQLGRDPGYYDLCRLSSISRTTFRERVGRMAEIRKAHREWVELRNRAVGGDAEATAELEERATAAGTLPAPPCPMDLLPEGLLDNLGSLVRPRPGMSAGW